MVLTRLAFLAGIVLLGQAAHAQTGLTGFGGGWNIGSASELMLIAFIGLLLWGFVSGLDALLVAPRLPAPRRLALRWIGLNRLEPSVTLLLIIIIAWRLSAEMSTMLSLWFALPALTFCGTLIPPVWFRSTSDPAVQDTWRGLRWIALARVAPYAPLGLNALLDQSLPAIAGLLLGLGALSWSWWVMARLATRLVAQLVPSSERMEINAE